MRVALILMYFARASALYSRLIRVAVSKPPVLVRI